MSSGFDATLKACKALGLDISTVPVSVLQIFYNSGQAFADHPGAMTAAQKQTWRDSVTWPKQSDYSKEPDTLPKLPPIIEKRKRGRPRKNPLPE